MHPKNIIYLLNAFDFINRYYHIILIQYASKIPSKRPS